VVATVVAAAAVVVASVLIGQLVCAVAGSVAWADSAPAVGLGALVGVAASGLHLAGHTTGPAIAILGLEVAGCALMWKRPDHRPPFSLAVPVLLVGAAVLVPFIAARRFGTLGVGLDDDMANHLLVGGAFQSSQVARVAPPLYLAIYPLGPHAVAATLASVGGISLVDSFTGFTIALPPLIAMVAWGQLRTLPRGVAQLGVFVVGTPYLVLAYMGEGSFKEPALAILLLGTIWEIERIRVRRRTGLTMFVPVAVIVVGLLSIYSIAGLWWPVVTAGAVAAASLQSRWRSGELVKRADIGRLLAPSIMGLCALGVIIAPQVPRLWRFYNGIVAVGNGSGIPVSNIGNLKGSLNPLETTGSWLSADFRIAPPSVAFSGAGALLICGCCVIGFVRLLRDGRLELPAATASCAAIWSYSALTQSAYTSAKALVIASPFVVCLAVTGLVGSGTLNGWWARGKAVIGGCLLLMLAASSYLALVASPVGPSAHADSMAGFRSIVLGRTTLVLEEDPFAGWYLAGARVSTQQLGPRATNPERRYKHVGWGSVPASVLARYDYVVAPIDPASGEPPASFRLVDISWPYDLFERRTTSTSRPSRDRQLARVKGDCRALARKGLRWIGEDAGRDAIPIYVPMEYVPEGVSRSTTTPEVDPGLYYVNMRYIAYEPVRIAISGLSTTMPATLEGLGTYWPVGEVTVRRRGSLAVRVEERPGLMVAPSFGLSGVVIQLTRLLRGDDGNSSGCN